MPETLLQSDLSREKQLLFINDVQINGVQAAHVDYRNNLTPLKFLGLNSETLANVPTIMRGNQVGTLGVSALAISEDQFIAFTGHQSVKGAIYKPNTFDQGVSFQDAYLTNYTSRYSYGQLPQIDATFLCLGDVGNVSRSDISVLGSDIFNQSSGVMKIPGPGCLSINLGTFETNRLIAYEINIVTNRTPVYRIGLRRPYQVKTAYPVEVTCSFQFEVNDYTISNQYLYPESVVEEDVTLSLCDYKTNETILSYSFSNLKLVSESYDTNVNGNAVVNAVYKTSIPGAPYQF